EERVEAVDRVQVWVRLRGAPGSLLLSRSEMKPHLRGFVPSRLSHDWVHPDPRMDELHRRVAATVEDSAHEREPPERSFARIAIDYAAVAGEDPRDPPALFAGGPGERRVPRLTESWFC